MPAESGAETARRCRCTCHYRKRRPPLGGLRNENRWSKGASHPLPALPGRLSAQHEALEKSFLDSLAFAATELRLLTDNYLAFGVSERPASKPAAAGYADPVGARWYNDQYEAVYERLTAAIKSYMTSTQSSLAPRTEQMKKNAYRAVTPVLISLLVMIAIVLLLYYFMMLYCVNPIVRINRSLGEWLQFRLPFRPKGDFQDELAELQEKIDQLIGRSRSQQN